MRCDKLSQCCSLPTRCLVWMYS